VVSLRIQDIAIRKEQRETDRRDRETKIEEEKNRLERLENDIATCREEAEQEEGFDEEQARSDWENMNPAIEIPSEVVDELDLDLEEVEAE
jgi:hypothetical protein